LSQQDREAPLPDYRLNRPGWHSTILLLRPLSQLFRVAKVLGPAGLLLVAKQRRTTKKVRSDLFQFGIAARRPCFFEADPGNGSQ